MRPRLCVFREKNNTPGMAEFLARSRQVRNATHWPVAEAVSKALPEGDKEKQLMQALLNPRESPEAVQGRLF